MKPQYINHNCPECGQPLVLADLLDDPDTDLDEIWNDEWACPKCYDGDGIYIDFEPEEFNELERRLKEVEKHPENTRPWDEVKREVFYNGMTEEEIAEEEKRIQEKVQKSIEENDFPKTRRILNFK